MADVAAKDFEDAFNKDTYVEDGKNRLKVECKFCKSKILEIKAANFVIQETKIPIIRQKIGENVDEEPVQLFWHVDNMYTFENIGFSHTVDNYKYLSCADCEAGPVGYHDLTTKHSYVCLSRVNHV